MEVDSIVKEAEVVTQSLEEDVKLLRDKYNRKRWEKEKLEEMIDKKVERLNQYQEEKETLEKVNLLLHQTSEFAREQSRQQIEDLVSNFLQYVFGEDFSFEIGLRNRAGQSWADFYVVSKQGSDFVKNEPQDSRGGGVVDVVSLALRIAILQSYQDPIIEGPLILDEPAKHVSEEYIVNVTRFLKEVNDMFERQVVVVTHQQHLSQVAHKAFKVELKDGKSRVKTVKSSNDEEFLI